MRMSTNFERDRDLIVVGGAVTGPAGCVPCRMLIDTGCGITMLDPELARRAGYDVEDQAGLSSVSSPGGTSAGYFLFVERLVALGFERLHEPVNVGEFEVKSHRRLDDLCADALLGLSFLDHFNYEIRSYESRILTERADQQDP